MSGAVCEIIANGNYHCFHMWDVCLNSSNIFLPLLQYRSSHDRSPWALACWAPFAFMGIEINRLTAPNTILANGSSYRRLSTSADEFDSLTASPMLRLNHLDRDLDVPSSSTGETAGIYLGILNLFTTLPQFVGMLFISGSFVSVG